MQTTATHTVTPQDLPWQDAHKIFSGLVAPRPIAWVSSISKDGAVNLAPFSFFNAVAGNPPTVMVSVGSINGVPKDTLRNIHETGEFVINIVSRELAAEMDQTGKNYPPEVNEFDVAGLAAAPSLEVRPPRVAAAAAAMEVKATQFVPVEGTGYTLVLGRVLRYHLREGLLRPNGYIDYEQLQPVARLGGPEYATLGEIFTVIKPE